MEPTPATPETPEFPKPLVRLRPVPGGYEAEVKMAADADAEQAATAEGYQVVEVPVRGPGFQAFPQWRFHADGRRQVVHTQAEADALEGFEETPPPPEETAAGGVPPPAPDAAMTASPNRPPVPADRG